VRAVGCVVAGRGCASCRGNMHAHHVRTRGAGGLAKANLVGLCAMHHNQLHSMGAQTFDAYYEVDLRQLATDLEAQWQAATES
jgi:hypothetical protein